MGVPSSAVIEVVVTNTTFVAFGNEIAQRMDILNNTGADILVRRRYRSGFGTPMLVKDGQGYTVNDIFNCNEVSVSRSSGTGNITVEAVYFA